MQKRLIAILVLFIFTSSALAGPGPKRDSRGWRDHYQKSAGKGQYANALSILRKSKSARTSPDDRAAGSLAIAEMLTALGKYDEAIQSVNKAISHRKLWAPALRAKGALLETLGRYDQAKALYARTADILADDRNLRDPESLVAIGWMLERHNVLSGRRASGQAQNILNNYLRRSYRKADTKYWPGAVAAGEFCLTKHRFKTASAEFKRALKLNRRCPDALVGLGAIALQKWEFEACLKSVSAAIRINPKHTNALLLKANCFMLWRKFDQVESALEFILKTNPNHLEALSLRSALHTRLGNKQDADRYAARVRKISPRYAGLPNTTAQWMAAGRQFNIAERQYRQATRLAPWMADPWCGLGRLYMQTGQEALARKALKRAHELDDFRSDVVNYLRVLRRLDSFSIKETPHFIIKVDPKKDAIMLDQVAEYMESIYDEVCRDFGHQLPHKTIIEIMPTHLEFSIRLAGKGWVGTIGACTGKVIVMAAPDKSRSKLGTFNWATVLRHEFTHVVTLSATGNRIPHWFTEACAVWQQPNRRDFNAVKSLVVATRENSLLSVKKLDWSFVRPRRGGERSLAYAQSEWMMEYVIATRGYDTIVRMIRCFEAGKSQQEMFAEVFGKTESQFDQDFAGWAKKQVSAWGYRATPMVKLGLALSAAKAKPKDPAAQATLAETLLAKNRLKQADAAAGAAIKLDPDNTRALTVLARCQLGAKQYDKALATAERLNRLDDKSRVAPRVLAQCYLNRRQWTKAIRYLELLKQRAPLDPWAYDRLARTLTQLGRPKDALGNLIHLDRRTNSKTHHARQIAEIYQSLDMPDSALDFYGKLIHINPYEVPAYEAIAAIHRQAGRYDKAVQTMEMVCLLKNDSPDAWTKLAVMQYLSGRAAGNRALLKTAAATANKAISLGESAQGRRLLGMIQATLDSLP